MVKRSKQADSAGEKTEQLNAIGKALAFLLVSDELLEALDCYVYHVGSASDKELVRAKATWGIEVGDKSGRLADAARNIRKSELDRLHSDVSAAILDIVAAGYKLETPPSGLYPPPPPLTSQCLTDCYRWARDVVAHAGGLAEKAILQHYGRRLGIEDFDATGEPIVGENARERLLEACRGPVPEIAVPPPIETPETTAVKPDPSTTDVGEACSARTSDARVMGKQELAIACLMQHPTWTNCNIAKHVGCHPKSLSRFSKFQKARAALRTTKDELPRGRKDKESGRLEAWNEKD